MIKKAFLIEENAKLKAEADKWFKAYKAEFAERQIAQAKQAKPQRLPIPTHEKRRALLKSWKIEDNGYYGSGLSLRLTGLVYGHPSFGGGELIKTSPLLRLDISNHTAETIHTVYLLG